MICQRCFRKLTAPPQMVGRYAYGPVCFSRMFPSPKRGKREKVVIVTDDKTLDMFAPCYFDTQGEADRLALIARHG